jgi:predicted nucleic acid-binding protein
MTIKRPIDGTVFLDTSYLIALVNPNDKHRAAALAVAEVLKLSRTRIVATNGVLLEIGNALSKRQFRPFAVDILSSMITDDSIAIVTLTDTHFTKAFQLFASTADKEWA